MKPNPHSGKFPHPRQRGMALVIVLGMLVLMLGLTLAYFSKAALQQQISTSSASTSRAEGIAQVGTECTVNDLLLEIEAGSEPDPLADKPGPISPIRNPLWVTTNGMRQAPSMIPQRVADNGIPNVIKKSNRTTAFFDSSLPGYRSAIASTNRAAAVSTSDPSRKGRKIVATRWNKTRLMTDGDMGKFTNTPPDWIYVDRAGKNATNFTADSLKKLSSPTKGNNDYVIGRYAYTIFDEGGLIDINTVGNGLPNSENSQRGRLHQVSLANGIGSVAIPKFSDFIKWRWPQSGTNNKDTDGGLFDPKRPFLTAEKGDQAFLNRQDLINYTARAGSPIPPEALPYLTTFSRDLDAPFYAPDPNRPKLPADRPADQFNPALLTVRFPIKTTLKTPEGDITVPAGTPVMPRRFPLSKLSLFNESNPDPATIHYYFGLKKSDDKWIYDAATEDGRIKKLSEVVAEGREPNFFEVLQAVIYTGSLGTSGGDTDTADNERDKIANLQVMQIGANIIDQWDDNDLPTTIKFTSPSKDEVSVYGIENLPYIHQMTFIPYRADYDRDLLQIWLTFDVWNPHQNAAQAPKDVTAFRIRPINGKASLSAKYQMTMVANNDAYTAIEGPTGVSSPDQSIPDLNKNPGNDPNKDPLIFSATQNYSEPVILGDGRPVTPEKIPGLLMGQIRLLAAIPKKEDRSAELQTALNKLQDNLAPYTATSEPINPSPHNNGDRVYSASTVFSGGIDNFVTDANKVQHRFWTVIKTPSEITVYANYGVKAHTMVQLNPSVTSDPLDLELQLQVGDKWITYQKIEGLLHDSNGETFSFAKEEGYSQKDAEALPATTNGAQIFDNTHHSAAPADSLTYCFYPWRSDITKTSPSASRTLARADPRTQRFGFSNTETDHLGLSFRSVALPWSGTTSQKEMRWLRLQKSFPGKGGDKSFEFWIKPGSTPSTRDQYLPYGLVTNNPDLPVGGLNASHPVRYADADKVIRPGDGYFGSLPMVSANLKDRPLILNRPFRSVGELGYAFRDLPWKTLDFSSRFSADIGLLDAFSVDELEQDPYLIAGKVNLNSARPEVLTALLDGTAKQIPNANAGIAETDISKADAQTIAARIVEDRTKNGPFANRGDYISRVFNSQSGNSPLTDTTKVEREGAVRTLAQIGTTRTWNFLIDIIAQTGRFTPNATSGADFLVEGECRRWVHVAIDRITGEVVDTQTETVHE